MRRYATEMNNTHRTQMNVRHCVLHPPLVASCSLIYEEESRSGNVRRGGQLYDWWPHRLQQVTPQNDIMGDAENMWL